MPLSTTVSFSGATTPASSPATALELAITASAAPSTALARFSTLPPMRKCWYTSAPCTVTTYGTRRSLARRCATAPSGSAWCAWMRSHCPAVTDGSEQTLR